MVIFLYVLLTVYENSIGASKFSDFFCGRGCINSLYWQEYFEAHGFLKGILGDVLRFPNSGFQNLGEHFSGQIITTSAEVTLNGGLIRELPQNPLNSGWGIILICPDFYWSWTKKSSPKSVAPLSILGLLHPRSLTASFPLKNGGWKTILSYWVSVTFRGELLNFGRVYFLVQWIMYLWIVPPKHFTRTALPRVIRSYHLCTCRIYAAVSSVPSRGKTNTALRYCNSATLALFFSFFRWVISSQLYVLQFCHIYWHTQTHAHTHLYVLLMTRHDASKVLRSIPQTPPIPPISPPPSPPIVISHPDDVSPVSVQSSHSG